MTIFEKIIAREVSGEIVFETEEILAFRDLHPQAPVHVLIIPKRPLARLAATTSDDEILLGRLLSTARDLAVTLEIAETGYRIVINNGRDAGESVPHLHVHLLGGRALDWPPG